MLGENDWEHGKRKEAAKEQVDAEYREVRVQEANRGA